MAASAQECAREVLDAVPLVMRAIRREMRQRWKPFLSVPQFRTLGFLHRYPGASLSAVAEHVGLALPSMSKMIDALSARRLVTRQTSPTDRRCVRLGLTGRGRRVLEVARQSTQARLAEMFAGLPPSDRTRTTEAMRALRRMFAVGDEPEAPREWRSSRPTR